jgi:hypothetical protein
MNNRRNFLKMAGMASIASLLPVDNMILLSTPKKLTIPLTTSNSDMRIGVNGVERMRIYANGNVGIGCINPSYELKIK